jgi:hypothetical protein
MFANNCHNPIIRRVTAMSQGQRFFLVRVLFWSFINVHGFHQVSLQHSFFSKDVRMPIAKTGFTLQSRTDTKANTPINSNSMATIIGKARGWR